MFKYFLIYEETYFTILSKEEYYKRFTYMKYDYINILRKSGKRFVTFHFKDVGYSKSLFYLSTQISFIQLNHSCQVIIRYKPNYFSIVVAILFALLMSILPAIFITEINIDNKPHIVNINDRLLIASTSLLPIGFLLADIYNYYRAKKWLKKELLLENCT